MTVRAAGCFFLALATLATLAALWALAGRIPSVAWPALPALGVIVALGGAIVPLSLCYGLLTTPDRAHRPLMEAAAALSPDEARAERDRIRADYLAALETYRPLRVAWREKSQAARTAKRNDDLSLAADLSREIEEMRPSYVAARDAYFALRDRWQDLNAIIKTTERG